MLQIPDGLFWFVAGHGDSRQPETGLAEVVDRLPVLDAFRYQFQDFLVMELGLVEVVQRHIDLAEVQAGFQQGRVQFDGLFELIDGGVEFRLRQFLELFCLGRFGRVGLALGLRRAGVRIELLAPPQQHAAEIIAGPRRNRFQVARRWFKCHSALSRYSAASFSLPSACACVAASE